MTETAIPVPDPVLTHDPPSPGGSGSCSSSPSGC